MRLILEVTTGPDTSRKFPLTARSTVVIGRKPPAEIVLADPTVSRAHCTLEFDGRTCRLTDLGSTHGTSVNGVRADDWIVLEGDLIQVGQSVLKATYSENEFPHTPPPGFAPVGPTETLDEIPTLPSRAEQVAAALRAEAGTLYAILDAARAPLVLARLLACKDERKSLYAGTKGDALMEVAPHLVALPTGSAFLPTIVREGWGQSWGVYLASPQPFAAIRKHLRHFLKVTLPSNEQVIFRFYDPRVLRVFLPTCTPDELVDFFGPIRSFLLESDDPDVLLRFRLDRGRLVTEPVEVSETAVQKAAAPDVPSV
jgi:Domain of unknown function (DUF4123)/Inner membrane component of T3SS, cytoplasmic domain